MESQWESYALALPNKVFEYLQSGLPIIHSGSDEVRRLLEQYGVGRWFAEGRGGAGLGGCPAMVGQPCRVCPIA